MPKPELTPPGGPKGPSLAELDYRPNRREKLPSLLCEDESSDEQEMLTPPGGAKGPPMYDDYDDYDNGDSSSDDEAEDEDYCEQKELEYESDLEDHQELRYVRSPIPAKSVTVQEAIQTAPAEHLRSLLLRLVKYYPFARVEAEEDLLVPSRDWRKNRKTFETCGVCGTDYHVLEDDYLGGCVVHTGKKEVDEEFWAEQESDIRGDPEDAEFMDDPDFAEGYRWSCCGQASDAEGCIVSRHVPKAVGSAAAGAKRRRI